MTKYKVFKVHGESLANFYIGAALIIAVYAIFYGARQVHLFAYLRNPSQPFDYAAFLSLLLSLPFFLKSIISYRWLDAPEEASVRIPTLNFWTNRRDLTLYAPLGSIALIIVLILITFKVSSWGS